MKLHELFDSNKKPKQVVQGFTYDKVRMNQALSSDLVPVPTGMTTEELCKWIDSIGSK